MNNRTRSIVRFPAPIAAIILLCQITTPLRVLAVENDQSPAAQITSLHVMYQPLTSLGPTSGSDAENRELLTEFHNMQKGGIGPSIPALEQFMSTYPNSPWLASLRANLGRYYQEHGQYTKAIQEWESAWAATREEKSGGGKQIADFTLAYCSKLLAALGSLDKLGSLLRESEGRSVEPASLQLMVNSSRYAYAKMCDSTDVSFRCGIYALSSVIQGVKGSAYDPRALNRTPAPATGFSMTSLVKLGQGAGANLVAAQWGPSRTLVVPCVVHWRQNHYGAILGQKAGMYQVIDSALASHPQWLTLAEIQEEASGDFIVPKEKLPQDWRLLTAAETDEIFGRGDFQDINDPTDGCGNNSGGGGGGGPGGGGRGGAGGGLHAGTTTGGDCIGCSRGGGGGGWPPGGTGSGPGAGGSGTGCCGGDSGSGATGGNSGSGTPYTPLAAVGCPVWEVSEPYLNMWLYDEPLGYQPGLGNRISFKLAYKQRESRTISADVFSLGPNWDCAWLSYVDIEPRYGISATLVMPGGGERTYSLDSQSGTSSIEYFSQTVAQKVTANGTITGLTVTYPDGAVDCYQSFGIYGGNVRSFLTARIDAFGHTNLFIYQTNGPVLLKYVIDADGRTNTLSYNTNSLYPSQIISVQDPFGRSTTLQYNSNGVLTNLIDTAGLTNSFQYDSSLFITTLTTPYGNTTFDYINTLDITQEPQLVRAVRVVDAVGGTNVYLLLENWNPFPGQDPPFAGEWDPTVLPTDANGLEYLHTDWGWLTFRDTFHWGPRQAAGLPTDLTQWVSANILVKAHMSHWLHGISTSLSQILGMEEDPSADGTTRGQTTWYDYGGRESEGIEGTNSLPSMIARVLPDHTIWSTAYQRDQWGHPTNVVETYSTAFGAASLFRTNQYVYATNGIDLVQAIGPRGETLWGAGYDAHHHVVSMTNAVREVTSYTYDPAGRLASIKTAAGLTTTNIYYSSGAYTNWVQTRIDLEIARTNSFTYTNDLVWTHTDERGLTTTNAWDNLLRLLGSADPRGTIQYTYGKLDLVRIVDRLGFTNSFGYDGLRRKIAETNALGYYTLYDYCPCGALDSVQDGAGNVTSFIYDAAGRRIQTGYPDNNYTVYYGLNLLGQVTNTTDSGNISITNWFNNQGLLYAVSNAFGQQKCITFDIEDRPATNIDANGVVVTSTFDNLSRVLTRTYPDNGTERFGYSAAGLIAYTNQLTNVTLYAYDAARRKTAETNANQETNTFTYSPAGDLLTLTDGKNQKTTWVYDQFGRVSNKWDNLNNLMFLYGYDGNNRLTNRWTPAKGNTAYRYDPVGNLTNIVYAHSPAITLQYDKMNRLLSMVDAVGTTMYGYDAAGQLLSEDGPWADDAVSYTYNYRRRASVSVQAPNASPWTQSYGYDTANRLHTITSPAGSFTYTYDPVRNLQVRGLLLPDSAQITNTYDNVARLLSTTLKSSASAVINSHSYTVNQGNQRTQQVFTAGNYVAYTYDNIGQLKTAKGKESGGVTNRLQEQLAYGYDAAGNLNWRTNNALVEAFNVNSLNELTTETNAGTLTVSGTTSSRATSVTVNSYNAALYSDYTFAKDSFALVNGANIFTAIAQDSYGRKDTNISTIYLSSPVSFTYDQNGNLTSDGNRNFAYDDENQLVSVWVTNVWCSNFSYDGKMRRRIRVECTWNGARWVTNQVIRYVYDGNLVVQERDTNNLPLVTYTRGRDLSGTLEGAGGIGGLVARTDDRLLTIGDPNAHAYYHCDGNGNITCLINSKQAIVAKYLYDPYGNTLSQSGSLADANLYRFSSKEFHLASGLVYYLYRLYDSNSQRWQNRDPKNEVGFKTLRGRRTVIAIKEEPIRYVYVGNNPECAYDPLGLTHQEETDIDSCLDNCLDDRNNAVLKATADALKHRCWGHIIFGGGTAIFDLLAAAQKGANLLVDLIGLGFTAAEAYEIVATVNEASKAKAQAQATFVSCCSGCGTKYGDTKAGDDYVKDHPLK